MEYLKHLLDTMFETRKLDSFTHHEGNKGVISIRFDGLLRSHVESQSVDQNISVDNHVTFKRKTKAQVNRDLERSKGLIKRHNTRSRKTNTEIENPRYSDHSDNILISNLSPEAAIFHPMFTSESDDIIPISSPVADSHHNTQEETSGASLHDEESSAMPECSTNALPSIDIPVMPSEPTEKQSNNTCSEMPTTDPPVVRESLQYLRLIGKAKPVRPRQLIVKRNTSHKHEPTLTKCHLCQKMVDFEEVGCCYYDKHRFDSLLYFCSDKCMDIYRDSDLLIDET